MTFLFYRRTVALYFTVCLLLAALMLRTVTVGGSLAVDALESLHTRTLAVGTTRGKIYDRSFSLLTDDTSRLLAAVVPCEGARPALTDLLGAAQADRLIQSGAPQVVAVPRAANDDFMRTFPVPNRTNGSLAAHLIGTVNAAGHGTSGIELGCDAALFAAGGRLSVRFSVNAAGKALAGYDNVILDQNYNAPGGVVLTVDKTVQALTEAALDSSAIRTGCALVTDAATGEVLAMASRPAFDADDLAAALNDTDAPLLNRTLLPYAAGSVFKPLIAAFALEHGVSPKTTFTCTGTRTVGGIDFHCYGRTAHGKQTMADALANSCNCYFIDLFKRLDPADFLAFCAALGLGETTDLGGGIVGGAGVLPSAVDLSVPAARANLAFGQGKLLLTPVQAACCYQVLATGTRTDPAVLRGSTDDGRTLQSGAPAAPQRLLSDNTVRTMQRLLYAAANADRSNAKSAALALAGKTGTAESGVVKGGRAVNRTWFAGFFPADAPQYVVVVMNEDGVSGNRDCAPVVKAIAEGIANSG